jgi:hypothetical protein
VTCDNRVGRGQDACVLRVCCARVRGSACLCHAHCVCCVRVQRPKHAHAHLRAHHVPPMVGLVRAAEPVAVVAGHRRRAAALEVASEDVAGLGELGLFV